MKVLRRLHPLRFLERRMSGAHERFTAMVLRRRESGSHRQHDGDRARKTAGSACAPDLSEPRRVITLPCHADAMVSRELGHPGPRSRGIRLPARLASFITAKKLAAGGIRKTEAVPRQAEALSIHRPPTLANQPH